MPLSAEIFLKRVITSILPRRITTLFILLENKNIDPRIGGYETIIGISHQASHATIRIVVFWYRQEFKRKCGKQHWYLRRLNGFNHYLWLINTVARKHLEKYSDVFRQSGRIGNLNLIFCNVFFHWSNLSQDKPNNPKPFRSITTTQFYYVKKVTQDCH